VKRNPKHKAEWRATEMSRLREKYDSYVSIYALQHDDADAATIGKAFVVEHPELLADFVELFIAELARQRKLPFTDFETRRAD
jgi:hypothetical protein